MLKFDKLSKIYFSPSGTTEKIVTEIAKNFNISQENYDLLSFDEAKEFSDELVIIGIPVFNGRIPKTACERLSKMKAKNTKAIVVLNYGNMDYGDALLELTELLKENNFEIVGVATTVSQHSQFGEIGRNRPDENDLKKINEFGRNIIKKLETDSVNEIFVGGYKPYQQYTTPDFELKCNEDKCIECMDCFYTCPEDAIPEDSPTTTNMSDCTSCSTCINVCPEGARSFTGPKFYTDYQNAIEDSFERKEAEFYL
ncbi:MAG: 4Fe-4S binding protein [Methanobrevibacter sp.]|nr:4Fe-4S binding protein [Methanobrevibacter sp.]